VFVCVCVYTCGVREVRHAVRESEGGGGGREKGFAKHLLVLCADAFAQCVSSSLGFRRYGPGTHTFCLGFRVKGLGFRVHAHTPFVLCVIRIANCGLGFRV
jgi:hypothetical protein